MLATGRAPAPARSGLRTLADALALRERLGPGVRLAIAGGGFVGTEVASTALALGAEVTLVEAARDPFEALLGREVGETLAARYRGARARPAHRHDRASAPRRRSCTRSASSRCGSSSRGSAPTPAAAPSTPGVYACGDVTGTGHWTARRRAGRRGRTGDPRRGAALQRAAYVWSDQFGLRLQLVGEPVPPSGSSSRAATTRSGPATSTARGACGRRCSPTARARSPSCAAS